MPSDAAYRTKLPAADHPSKRSAPTRSRIYRITEPEHDPKVDEHGHPRYMITDPHPDSKHNRGKEQSTRWKCFGTVTT